MVKKLNIKIAKQIALSRDGQCLAKKYINNAVPMLWQCKYGHQWKARLANVKNSATWCPTCNKNSQKNGINKANHLASKKNGKCLSTKYVNAQSKLIWQCEKGHVWNARYNDIHNGQWCPYCSKKVKHTIIDCKNIAKLNDGKCLSNKYINSKSYLVWQCVDGHTWKASFNGIVNAKNWCPECATNKTQKLLTQIIRKIYDGTQVYSCYNKFKWLMTDKNRKQELDIYIPALKLAIEYDGEQHFMPVQFGGTSKITANKKYKRQKQLDKIKNKKIRENKCDIKYFIRFNYKEKDKLTFDYITNKLIKNNIPIEVLDV